jgi:hypothetical protein
VASVSNVSHLPKRCMAGCLLNYSTLRRGGLGGAE